MADPDAPPTAPRDSDRRRRLAVALRENLRRRKAASRARAGDGADMRGAEGGAGDGSADGDD